MVIQTPVPQPLKVLTAAVTSTTTMYITIPLHGKNYLQYCPP